MPTFQPYLIEHIWEQFRPLVPERETDHPLGCHRPCISDRMFFEKLVQVLLFGCAYERITDQWCSATTLRRRHSGSWLSKPTTRSSVYGYPAWLSTAASPKLPVVVRRSKPAPPVATNRWVVERANSRNNAQKNLVWRTQSRDEVINFWMAFSEVVIIVGRLIREG